MTPRSARVRRRAFSLLELLVAISVMALLAGILAPALASARRAAQAAACASNIRQLQLANNLYANEHAGRFIPGAEDFLGNLHRWHGSRSRASEPFDAAGGPITPYLGAAASSRAVRVCPTFAPALRALAASGLGFERSAGGYGYNNAFVGVERRREKGRWLLESDARGSRRDRFAHPADTIAFTDAAFASDRGVEGLIEYSFAEPRIWPDSPGARPDPSIHFRHAGRASVAWLDGHVSSERRGFTVAGWFARADSGALGLGWIGGADSDDNRLFDYE